jgi:alkanesulfonate monooxygenase SsuD/methylene tetrahydromethanopterin reductase-like flavin-dependent oxidoreductase (luciferase family)
MEIGMNLPVMVPGLDRARILDWCGRIDRGPFSHVASGERMTFPNPEITVTLSAAAAVTSRVKIFYNVLVLPMHSATWAAKQVATLDVLSDGRVVLGVGAGAREEDYRAADAPFGRRRLAQMGEQVALMRRVWAGENVLEGALRPIEPLPVQAGGPPVLAGSLSPRAIAKVAAWADGLCGFSFGPSAEEVATCFDHAREAWRAADRPPPRLVTSCFFALGPDARSQLDVYLARYLNFMGAEVAKALAPTVTTDSVAKLRDVVKRLEDCGTDELSLVPTTLDADEIDRVVDALA